MLRQSGPRFASNTERLVGDQNLKAMQDYNLFAQNVLESGRNRQLSALFGAGEFANRMQGQQLAFNLPLLQQMYESSFRAGGLFQQPTVVEQKPWWQQALGVVGTGVGIASNAASLFGGGGGGDPLAGEGALTGDTGPYGGAGGMGGGLGSGGGGYISAPAPNMSMSGMGGVAPAPGTVNRWGGGGMDWQQFLRAQLGRTGGFRGGF